MAIQEEWIYILYPSPGPEIQKLYCKCSLGMIPPFSLLIPHVLARATFFPKRKGTPYSKLITLFKQHYRCTCLSSSRVSTFFHVSV